MASQLTFLDSVSGEHVDGFYPTPKTLAKTLLTGIDFAKVESILEPSAGDGSLVEAIQCAVKATCPYMREEPDIDCVEIDPSLQAILRGKGFRIVHDDFLTFRTYKQYHLIAMNPPFKNADTHLHKALDLIENGGEIRCIVNAQTLLNPNTNQRKLLVRRLEEAGAVIEYMDHAFMDGDRKTDVQIAIVKCAIQYANEEGYLLRNLRTAQHAHYPDGVVCDLEKSDPIDKLIDRFNFEAQAGITCIREYKALIPYMQDSVEEYAHSILQLKVRDSDATENGYLSALRTKFWRLLFTSGAFMGNLTSNMRDQLYQSVSRLRDYEFSLYNIMQMRCDLHAELLTNVDKTILKLFDDWTHKYSWYDSSKNIHYFNGWATNNAFKVAKKVIVPFYNAFDSYDNRFRPGYQVIQYVSDIEKVFDHLSGVPSNSGMVDVRLRQAEANGQSRSIPFKYFTLTFYKKRTVHINFTDEEAVYRFNLYAARHKQWLPPTYGKKQYRHMTEDERSVIDSFEGEARYEQTRCDPDAYFLNGQKMIGASEVDVAIDT